jgi:hypothetical protein
MLLFQFFLSISHLISCSQSADHCSLLTPCKSSSCQFWEIVRHSQKKLKGTVSPDFLGFFMTYDIKSVLSAWALMVFKFFHQVVILIF